MMNFNWTLSVLVFSPLAAFLVSILGVFDIKKDSAEELFKKYLERLRGEKIKIWKELITIRNKTLEESEVNNQLLKTLESEERYNELNIILKNCRKHFDCYYLFLLYLFCVGVILVMSKFLFPNFFSQEVIACLSVITIIGVLIIILGMIFLVHKKKKLTEYFDKVISLSSLLIDL